MSKVVSRPLPDSLCGYFEYETDTIHINRDMSPRSKRSTWAHETVHRHMAHGPVRTMPEYVAREVGVEAMTARMLIPFPAFLRAMTKFSDMLLAAAYLDVDPSVLYARIMGLDRLERLIFDVCCRQCLGILSAAAMVATAAIPIISSP
jgi:Zn-dependent peptidase ImmA (M78 family)